MANRTGVKPKEHQKPYASTRRVKKSAEPSAYYKRGKWRCAKAPPRIVDGVAEEGPHHFVGDAFSGVCRYCQEVTYWREQAGVDEAALQKTIDLDGPFRRDEA